MERKCILFQTNKIQEQILQIIAYSAMGIRRKRNCSPAIYSRCKFWGHINQAKSRSLGLAGLKSHSSPNTTRDLPPHCPRPPHRNIWWTLLPQNHDQNTLLLLAKNISSFSSIQYSWGWSRAVTAVAGLLLLLTFANLLLAYWQNYLQFCEPFWATASITSWWPKNTSDIIFAVIVIGLL